MSASEQRLTPFGDPNGSRTRVTAVKGRCLNHLTTGPYEAVRPDGLTLALYKPDSKNNCPFMPYPALLVGGGRQRRAWAPQLQRQRT